MEKSFEVKNAVSRLTAMGDVKPELKPVVAVALSVVDAARAEIEEANARVFKAEQRARLAEETLAGVTPHVNELEDHARALERSILRRSEIDAAREMEVQKAERRARDWAPNPEQVGRIARMADQVEHIRAATLAQPEAVARAAQLLTVIHRSVRNEDGRSPIQTFAEHGHVWTVRDCDEGVIAETDSRREAIQLVADLLAEELAEIAEKSEAAAELTEEERYRPDDTMHRPAPWRERKPKRVEQPPAPGPIAQGESKRKSKKRAIIL